jgi:hypothetical protein
VRPAVRIRRGNPGDAETSRRTGLMRPCRLAAVRCSQPRPEDASARGAVAASHADGPALLKRGGLIRAFHGADPPLSAHRTRRTALDLTSKYSIPPPKEYGVAASIRTQFGVARLIP